MVRGLSARILPRRSDCSTGYPQRWSEIDWIEIQAKTGHQIIPIHEDLGPLSVETSSIGQNSNNAERFDKGVAINADQSRSELDSLLMSEDPVKPASHTLVTAHSCTEQFNGAFLGEAGYDSVDLTCLEGIVEFRGGLTDQGF